MYGNGKILIDLLSLFQTKLIVLSVMSLNIYISLYMPDFDHKQLISNHLPFKHKIVSRGKLVLLEYCNIYTILSIFKGKKLDQSCDASMKKAWRRIVRYNINGVN